MVIECRIVAVAYNHGQSLLARSHPAWLQKLGKTGKTCERSAHAAEKLSREMLMLVCCENVLEETFWKKRGKNFLEETVWRICIRQKHAGGRTKRT